MFRHVPKTYPTSPSAFRSSTNGPDPSLLISSYVDLSRGIDQTKAWQGLQITGGCRVPRIM